jgi:D-alanyl-D-alanine carboxypeptidase (penicillin-binding protein 5/6)
MARIPLSDDLGGPRGRGAGSLALAALLAAAAALAVMLLPGHEQPAPVTTPIRTHAAPHVRAWSAVVMDPATGVILYAKAPDRRLPMASLTKIMTASLVLERMQDLEAYVTVPATAIGQPGAKLGLSVGDQITVRQLLLGLMVRSATDCAITLATAVAGDETHFVQLMNRRAAALGLANTHFVNASGVNVRGHYSSARDLSTLTRTAVRDSRFRLLARRVWATVTWPPAHEVRLHSHNRLNELYDWVDGVKTGFTEGTGACLVATGKYGARRLIVTTLHQPSRDQEVRDALTLFAYGASRFARKRIVRAGERVGELPLEIGGRAAALTAGAGLARVVRKGAPVTTRLSVPGTLQAAPARDEVVGYATFWSDGVLLGSVPVRAEAAQAVSLSATPPATP